MDFAGWVVWGFAGTVVLTGLMTAAQGLGLTRMDLPFMLGLIFSRNRDVARVLGVIVHLINGWIFALVYVGAFETADLANLILGPATGAVHGAFVLMAGMPALPGMHPRMASETWGPEPTQALEPPGFLALNYGKSTPIVIMIAHVVYGGVLGVFY